MQLRVGSTFRRVGSGPRKVARGQLCFNVLFVLLTEILIFNSFFEEGLINLMRFDGEANGVKIDDAIWWMLTYLNLVETES